MTFSITPPPSTSLQQNEINAPTPVPVPKPTESQNIAKLASTGTPVLEIATKLGLPVNEVDTTLGLKIPTASETGSTAVLSTRLSVTA